MKSNKELRGRSGAFDSGDLMKKAVKLDPIKKSGKDRIILSKGIDQEDDDIDLNVIKKRESVLDYFDDGQDNDQEEDWEDDEEFDDDEYSEEDEDEEEE